ncbi:MAG: condensation domain-containing protein, partial [Paracoccaceae bacterium]
LRTRFAAGEKGPEQIIDDFASADLECVDLTGDVEVLDAVSDLAGQPFDLADGPLVRFHLLQVQPGYHVLAVTLHHIITDGWSNGVLYR